MTMNSYTPVDAMPKPEQLVLRSRDGQVFITIPKRPKLDLFARVVQTGLKHGVHLTRVEIAELMGESDQRIRSVATYGFNSTHTQMRDYIYRVWGIPKPRIIRRTTEQSVKIMNDLRAVL